MSILSLSFGNERYTVGNSCRNVVIRLRPATRSKLDMIAAARRWSLAEAADAAIEEFIRRHRIPKDGQAKRAAEAAH